MRFTIWNTGGDPRDFFRIAEAAEQSGWSAMCLNEGTFQPAVQEDEVYPFTSDGRRNWRVDTPYLEPLTMLAAIAAQHPRLRVLTWVLKLPLREPLTFAKQIATAALMSESRLDLGVGMSWMPQEFRYTGVEWGTRRRRFVEMIEVLRLVLTGEMVEYHGKVFDFGPLMERPVPVDPVPILLGGHKPASLRMAAELGDGWCGVTSPTATIEELVRALHEQLERADRDPKAFTVHTGSLDAATVDDYARLAEIGVTDCIVMPWMTALGDAGTNALDVPIELRLELVHRFGEDVIHPLNGST